MNTVCRVGARSFMITMATNSIEKFLKGIEDCTKILDMVAERDYWGCILKGPISIPQKKGRILKSTLRSLNSKKSSAA